MMQSSRTKSSNQVEFGPFNFDLDGHLLTRNGEVLPLKRQSAAVLALLVASAGSVVKRSSIRDTVWHDRTIEFDDGINACVRDIRRVLGDNSKDPIYIETIPKTGYRLKAEATAAPKMDWLASRRAIAAAVLAVFVGAMAVYSLAFQAESTVAIGGQDRIAVMPFAAMDKSEATLQQAELLTHQFVARLSEHQKKLLVISVGELFGGDGPQPGMGDVSKWLSVDYLLAGSIVSETGGKSLTLRVIRTDGYVHLWSKSLPLDPNQPGAVAEQLFTQMINTAVEENGRLLFTDPLTD